jgi:adenylosuccinate synthase
MVVTKLDVLDELDTIKIAVAYRHKGRIYKDFPANIEILWDVEPVYEELPGWGEDTSHVGSFSKLPTNAKKYLKELERLIGVKIELVSVGSRREQVFKMGGKGQR